MQRLSQAAAVRQLALAPDYWRLARWWFWLGVPAFTAMVLIVVMMVAKHVPGVGS
jgi:uncharacterized membrane protein